MFSPVHQNVAPLAGANVKLIF